MSKLTDILDSAPRFFASGYTEAHELFREACHACGVSVEEYPHPLRGPEGEALSIDVALRGRPDAANLVIVISGTHGVEGLAGSGGQIAWLQAMRGVDLPVDTAVLLVHMLNPWGCAWTRRQNEDNVDLNRNFCDFAAELPANPLYEAVHEIVVNRDRVVRAASDSALQNFRSTHGDQALAIALFSGQYRHSDGVGFGGNKLSWSNHAIRAIVAKHTASAKRITLVDIHTGLGPYGYGTLLSAEPPGSPALARARSSFGPGLMSVSEDPSVPYHIHGSLLTWVAQALHCEVTSIAVEFGTSQLAGLLELQVDDCRLQNSHEAWADLRQVIRNDLLKFFFPATTDWLQAVALRTVHTIHLAIRGLQSAPPATR